MANVDAASKDAVLVPDVKAFQKSLHLNAGAFHVFQFALKGFLMMSVPNQQMPQVTTRSMPKRSSNISQSRRCPENGEAASSKGAPPRGLTAFSGRFGTAGGSHPKNPRDILTNHHKATSQPAEASQSCILRLSGAGL
jgi:hypothetical protein